jgi:acetylornithine deacetylase/succinyl-diaminopimelate desuccinylase-like protein
MNIEEYVAEQSAGFFEDLQEWLRIPSVSADPARQQDMRQSAQWLADYLRRCGFPVVETWPTGSPDDPGQPAVFAEWPAADPDAPTVLIYGHHDVQPGEPREEWLSDPFVPVVQGDYLLGRGVSDDKGQVLFHTLGLRANLAARATGSPPVTVRLLIEGEEESGSPHLPQLLEDKRERLRADTIVISDTAMWAADIPSMCTGMRGLVDCEIQLRGPETDLHSGSFGGAVPNPLHAMAAMLAGLHDATGRVTLDRFYDGVRQLSQAERDSFASLPFDEKEWLATAGNSQAATGEDGFSTLERVWARPTAEVNGMWGGHTGQGPKTIVPQEAHAKVSFRLVDEQQPAVIQQAIRDYVASRVPAGISAEVTFGGPGLPPCFSDISTASFQAALRAMEHAFGSKVLLTREGGSGPEAYLATILGAPLVFLGVGLDSDHAHAPNEQVEMGRLLRGAVAAGRLLDELAVSLAWGPPVAGQ